MTEKELEEERKEQEIVEKRKETQFLRKLDGQRTWVRLPSRLPKPDPEWMLKKFRRDILTAEEIEDYMKWKHAFKMQKFKKHIKGVHEGTLIKVHQETAYKKIQCEVGSGCEGWNKDVYSGYFGNCGPMDPFIIWSKHVKMKDFNEPLDMFMELFDYAIFETPRFEGVQFFMNCYWQSKYGFFTCYDMWVKWGTVNFDGNLIEKFEKPRDLHRQWNLACMSWMYNHYLKKGELLLGIDYTQSKEYKKLYANN